MSTDEKKPITETSYLTHEVDGRKMYGYTLAAHPHTPASALGEKWDNVYHLATDGNSSLVTVVEDEHRSKGGSSYACEVWIADNGSGMDLERLGASNTFCSHTYMPQNYSPDDFNLSAFGIGGTVAAAWFGRTKITLTKQANGDLLKSEIRLDDREDFPGDTPIPLDKLARILPTTDEDEAEWLNQTNLCFPDGPAVIPSHLTHGTLIRITDFHPSRQGYKALPLMKELIRYASETYASLLEAGKTIGIRRLKRKADGTYESKGDIHWCEAADVTYQETYIDSKNKGALRCKPDTETVYFPGVPNAPITLTFTHLESTAYNEINKKRGLHKEKMATTACAAVRRCGRLIKSKWRPAALFPISGGTLDRLRVMISYDDTALDGYFGISPYKNAVSLTPEFVKFLQGLECVKRHKLKARTDRSADASVGEVSDELQDLADRIASQVNDSPRSFGMSKRPATPSENGRGKDTKPRKPRTNVGAGTNKVYNNLIFRIHSQDPTSNFSWVSFDDDSYDPIININSEAPIVKELLQGTLNDHNRQLVMDLMAASLLAEIGVSDVQEAVELCDDLKADATKFLKNFAAKNK